MYNFLISVYLKGFVFDFFVLWDPLESKAMCNDLIAKFDAKTSNL